MWIHPAIVFIAMSTLVVAHPIKMQSDPPALSSTPIPGSEQALNTEASADSYELSLLQRRALGIFKPRNTKLPGNKEDGTPSVKLNRGESLLHEALKDDAEKARDRINELATTARTSGDPDGTLRAQAEQIHAETHRETGYSITGATKYSSLVRMEKSEAIRTDALRPLTKDWPTDVFGPVPTYA